MVIPSLKLKKGDIVRLQSGGPKMLVKWIRGDIAGCQWLSRKEKKSEIFVNLLEKVGETLPAKKRGNNRLSFHS